MPTSYTTNLRLALPATGELSGTWGNTVNNAITTLLDDSIGGYVAIAVSAADQALTANNGLTDQSRQAVLSVSNTYGAAVSLYAPPVEKLYVIYNSNATYNLTFKVATVANGVVASGGSTVVIPPLKRVIVYVDTFNVVEQMNYVAGDITLAANVTLGDASTDTVQVNGYMGVGGAGTASAGVYVGSTALTSTGQFGFYSAPTFSSAATSLAWSFRSSPATAAAVFTLGSMTHYRANNLTLGAGSIVTEQHGVQVADLTSGGSNYGITSLVSSGTNKWNIYASGTAQNYFAGDVLIGTTSTGLSKVRILDSGSQNIELTSSTTNAVAKSANITISRYTNAETPFSIIRGQSDATNNFVNIGGGATTAAPSTFISMYTSTLSGVGGTGTERLRVDSEGRYGFNYTGTLGGASGQYRFSGSITGAASPAGLIYAPTIQTDATGTSAVFQATPFTTSNSGVGYTLAGINYFAATQGTFNADSTVTNQYGFLAQSTLTGATNNFGFYSNIAAATGRWNFYANGTALNYFAGNVGTGTSSPAYKLDIHQSTLTNTYTSSSTTLSTQDTVVSVSYRGRTANTPTQASFSDVQTTSIW